MADIMIEYDNHEQYLKDVIWEIERENLVQMPNFSIWHLNIRQAAELITLDMWYSGDIEDVGEPEGWDETECDPKLLESLAKYVQEFETRLLNAVELGRLKTAKIKRNLNEQIVSVGTYINYYDLLEWLDERGYNNGEVISDWSFTEGEISDLVSQEVHYLRATIKENKGKISKISLWDSTPDESNANDLRVMYKAMVVKNHSLENEIHQLKTQLIEAKIHQAKKLDKPVSAKARKSFLLIIEALCKKNNIDSQERGVAGRIQRIVGTEIGKSIDDDTVRKIFNQISDALE